MHTDLLFETDRFNLSEVKAHFINPICFGEDLASWLRSKLIERGVATIEPGQEDWGWYIECTLGEAHYFIGVGGNADESPDKPNQGEWRLMIEKKRTLRDRITGKNVFGADDPMLSLLDELIRAEPAFSNIRHDAGD